MKIVNGYNYFRNIKGRKAFYFYFSSQSANFRMHFFKKILLHNAKLLILYLSLKPYTSELKKIYIFIQWRIKCSLWNAKCPFLPIIPF